ncbi:hypothetical protein CPB85DRAFT_1568217 [Mucidula mucida]|nr:hypothetical protein CPB85DRAFT_1568217 [Mucidula mucida]
MSASTEGQTQRDKHTTSITMTFFNRKYQLDAAEDEDEGLLDSSSDVYADMWKTYRFEDPNGELAELWRRAVEWQSMQEATEDPQDLGTSFAQLSHHPHVTDPASSTANSSSLPPPSPSSSDSNKSSITMSTSATEGQCDKHTASNVTDLLPANICDR